MSIPKIIHYCWFGNRPLPARCKKMIASWKKYCPDYEIMLWDEEKFDITSSEYVKAAYHAGKYAFVSDFVRLCALKEYGGIYLDTDMEVIGGFGNLLDGYSAAFGFEAGNKVMTAVIAAQPDHPIINEFLNGYANKTFDASNLEPNTVMLTEILKRRGLELNNSLQLLGDGAVVFPTDYFQSYDFSKAKIIITENTRMIHRCYGSWCSPEERVIFFIKRTLGKYLSEEGYSRLKRIKKKIMGE